MLSTEVAEVTILQFIVLVCVHVREDLEDNVTIEFHIQLVHHMGEVSKGDIPSITLVEDLECC